MIVTDDRFSTTTADKPLGKKVVNPDWASAS